MQNIYVFLFLLLFTTCSIDDHSREHYRATTKISEDLYVETYSASSDILFSDWITDSTNFRFFIGSYNKGEEPSYKCSGDSVFLTRVAVLGKSDHFNFNTTAYSLEELRKLHHLDMEK